MPIAPADPSIRRDSAPGPWRILLTDPRKSLFHLINDPRVEILAAYDAQRPPHLIVVRCANFSEGLRAARALPQEAFLNAAVALDATGKGTQPEAGFMLRLGAFLETRGVAQERCAFLSNNRRLNLYGSKVRLLYYDYWLRRMYRSPHEWGDEEFQARHALFQARGQQRPRRFLSFNMTARTLKVLFLLRLMRDGLWNAGYVSFGGLHRIGRLVDPTPDQVRRSLLAAPGFEDMAAELVQLLPALDAKGRVLFGAIPHSPRGRVRKATAATHLAEFDLSWFSATTETEMSPDKDYVTEKPFKPLLNFHPQVIFGNCGALRRLRAFGFQSFSPWIDESYDDEPDPRRRFDMAYAQVQRLCAMDEAEMSRFDAGLREIVVANARWGLVGMPEQYRRVWDPELVSALLALSPAAKDLPV